jgi:hypothetical protein
MPDEQAIVATTIRLDPPLDGNLTTALERGIEVELDGQRRVRLDPANPRSGAFAQVLDGLRVQKLPVYLEIDADTNAVSRLLIPHVDRVLSVEPSDEGYDVQLEQSHARHRLRSADKESAGLVQELRRAQDAREVMVVTEDEEHIIIDVRPFRPGPEGDIPFPPIEPKPEVVRRWFFLRWLDILIEQILCWWRCPTYLRAQTVFNALAATTCDPQTVPSPCIPFKYPDDGCWGRAHEMCRLMIIMGLSPRKVWIDKSGPPLHVNTKNNPNCYVEWYWHVAPTLCVRSPWWFSRQLMVIDPSLFTTPVSVATWKSVQNNPNATLTYTDYTQFSHGGGTDPTYASTNSVLATYRLNLQNRSISYGPPPYNNCP